MPSRSLELVCPAGNLPALKLAIDNGADAVYMGLKNNTNARNFAGLNFDEKSARAGVEYAHQRSRKVLMAINTYAKVGQTRLWHNAIDQAVDFGADAIIMADMGMLTYACKKHPRARLHLSVQGSATNYEAINLAQELFGIERVILPRVLTVDQVRQVIENTRVEVEVFGFGSLCVMVEGRCLLSSYVTGESPNTHGVCSPAKYVQWDKQPGHMNVRLNKVLIDRFAEDESAGYPTLCKGRFTVRGETYYALEEPTSLNVLEILPELLRIGATAIKVEGRQRSPAYSAQVTQVLRQALDALADDRAHFHVKPQWMQTLGKVSEGQQATLGAYSRPWK